MGRKPREYGISMLSEGSVKKPMSRCDCPGNRMYEERKPETRILHLRHKWRKRNCHQSGRDWENFRFHKSGREK